MVHFSSNVYSSKVLILKIVLKIPKLCFLNFFVCFLAEIVCQKTAPKYELFWNESSQSSFPFCLNTVQQILDRVFQEKNMISDYQQKVFGCNQTVPNVLEPSAANSQEMVETEQLVINENKLLEVIDGMDWETLMQMTETRKMSLKIWPGNGTIPQLFWLSVIHFRVLVIAIQLLFLE